MAAHDRSCRTAAVDAATASMIDKCLGTWPPDLFAYLLGAGTTAPLADWHLDAALADGLVRARLRLLHDLAQLFNNRPAARAWVRRRNADLGDRPPADVIRTATGDDLSRVRDVAERQIQKY